MINDLELRKKAQEIKKKHDTVAPEDFKKQFFLI